MIPAFIAEALAAIGTSLPVAVLVKATALMGLALLAGRVARRSRAAIRHLIFAAAIAVTLVLPIATLIVPAVDVPVPARLSLFERAPATATTAERAGAMDALVLSSEVAPVSSSVSTSTIVWTIWGTGFALFLFVPVAGLWQIRRLRRRGMPWPDGEAAVRPYTLSSSSRSRNVSAHARAGLRSPWRFAAICRHSQDRRGDERGECRPGHLHRPAGAAWSQARTDARFGGGHRHRPSRATGR
jgi:hypothetical protein